MREFRGYIHITKHAKERFIERRLNTSSNKNTEVNVYKKMINMIKRSTLTKYVTKDDGRVHEYREYAGCIFVCHREYSKEYFKPDLVTIITVELTPGYIKSVINKGYNEKNLSLNTYITEKVKELYF